MTDMSKFQEAFCVTLGTAMAQQLAEGIEKFLNSASHMLWLHWTMLGVVVVVWLSMRKKNGSQSPPNA